MNKLSQLLKFLHSTTIRLALSYLAIIMVLSISFSVIFYQASTQGIGFKVPNGTVGGMATSDLSGAAQAVTGMSMPPAGVRPGSIPQAGVINAELQQRLNVFRTDLRNRLFLLNVGVLLVGAAVSYYLARRTLRPIEAAMEAQARFASDASHELRTPLTVMQSETEGALRMLELPERARLVFKSNLEEIAQLKELSEGLLRLAQDADAMPVEPVWVDEVVAKAEHSAMKIAKTKSITIDTAVPHTEVLADTPSLVQTISILLDNAIKYSPEKSVINIEAHTDNKQANTFVRVRDQGIGIEDSELKHIFDRFYRSERGREQSASGHGLGLSIAQKLVEQQRGRLTVESKLGKGSTFTIKLPAFKNS